MRVRERATRHLASILAASAAAASAAHCQQPPPVVCDPLPPPRTAPPPLPGTHAPPPSTPGSGPEPFPGLPVEPPPVVCDPMPAPYCPPDIAQAVAAEATWQGPLVALHLSWFRSGLGRGGELEAIGAAAVTGATLAGQHTLPGDHLFRLRPQRPGAPMTLTQTFGCEGRTERLTWTLTPGKRGEPIAVIRTPPPRRE